MYDKKWRCFCKKMKNNKGTKREVVETCDECSLTLVLTNDKWCSDHNAVLKEVRTDGIIVSSKLKIPPKTIDHGEAVIIGGKGQPMPFIGKLAGTKRNGDSCEYNFSFGPHSYYAQKFLSIHSPKAGAGRKPLCKKKSKAEQKKS